jgi:glycine/D-amino acid oxidase-like deaminating enzyme
VEYDVLILGRGIAGAVLAELCQQRGLSFHVIDHKRPGNATMAAGGVVNPMVLRRDVPCWRAAECMALSNAFYRRWQQRLGISAWHPAPVVKLFPGPNEVKQWERALHRPEAAPFIDSRPEPEIDAAPLHAPHGYGTVVDAAWLDLPLLLGAQRDDFLGTGLLTEGNVEETEIGFNAEGISIRGVKGKWLIRCTGAFAKDPGLVPVKGEMLTLRIPGLQLSRIVHGGVGLMPLGDGLFRVGATFQWDNVWGGPTIDARELLLRKLAAMVSVPVDVVAQHAGVRPTARDRRPILGKTGPRSAVLNGLGVHGVMHAPWCAAHLLDHLFAGTALDPEVDRERFA